MGEKNEMYDFWTSPWAYWEMEKEAPVLFAKLKESGLVIFKVRICGMLKMGKLCIDI